MSQFSNTNDSANSYKVVAQILNQGYGHANMVANNTALFDNTSPRVFLNPHPLSNNIAYYKAQAVGQFAVEANQVSNTGAEGGKVTHSGFNLRKAGMGGIATFVIGGGSGYTNNGVLAITAASGGGVNAYALLTTNSTGGVTAVNMVTNFNSVAVANSTYPSGLFTNTSYLTISNPNGAVNAVTIVTAGAGYNTGDIITFSNGSVNAIATITSNATTNVHTVTVTLAGSGFPSANANVIKAVTSANGGATGNGVTSVTVSAGGTGYNNTDVITFSNGVINATSNPVTNSTGGITSITMLSPGSGFAGPTNTAITAANSTGGASAGSGATLVPVETSATFSVTVDAGTNANVTVTLAGRAGRVFYECLVATSSIGHGAGSNSSQLPN